MADRILPQQEGEAVGNRHHQVLGAAFWRLWAATTVSNLGDGLELSALPLLAASLSRDPRLVAGVTTAATLPLLVFGLLAGVIADRGDRRSLMRQVNLVSVALTGLIAILVATRLMDVWTLYLLVFLLGAAQTLSTTASQALLPDLVAVDQLEIANSRWKVGEMLGNAFVGPALGGLLFAIAAPVPFVLDAVSFLCTVALVTTIRGNFNPGQAALRSGTSSAGQSIWGAILEGLRWLSRHRLLRSLVIVLGLANLAICLAEGILVLFATGPLGLSKQGFGLLLTGIAVGGVLGGLMAVRLADALGPARTIVLTIAVLAVCYAVIGMLSQAVVAGVIAAGTGFASTVWNVVTISLRQALIPRALMGRVNSAYLVIGMGTMPIGALLGGFLASAFGIRFPFFAAGAMLLVALVIAAVRINGRAIDTARRDAQTT